MGREPSLSFSLSFSLPPLSLLLSLTVLATIPSPLPPCLSVPAPQPFSSPPHPSPLAPGSGPVSCAPGVPQAHHAHTASLPTAAQQVGPRTDPSDGRHPVGVASDQPTLHHRLHSLSVLRLEQEKSEREDGDLKATYMIYIRF